MFLSARGGGSKSRSSSTDAWPRPTLLCYDECWYFLECCFSFALLVGEFSIFFWFSLLFPVSFFLVCSVSYGYFSCFLCCFFPKNISFFFLSAFRFSKYYFPVSLFSDCFFLVLVFPWNDASLIKVSFNFSCNYVPALLLYCRLVSLTAQTHQIFSSR